MGRAIAGEVRFDGGARAAYASDASNYRQVMCGQSVNAAVVIDCSKYLDRVVSVDPAARVARVEPGAVCDALREAAELLARALRA